MPVRIKWIMHKRENLAVGIVFSNVTGRLSDVESS
jgi:hypothetical protein